MPYWTYIIECYDQKLYTGVTNNLERRMHEHAQGFNPKCFTYTRRPIRYLWSEEFPCVEDAIVAEKQIKGWSRKKKFALIEGGIKLVVELTKSTHR